VRVGFEPTLEFPLNTLSKRALDVTPPLEEPVANEGQNDKQDNQQTGASHGNPSWHRRLQRARREKGLKSKGAG